MAPTENLVTLTLKSTHYYLVQIDPGYLLFDAGWPGMLPQFLHQLKTFGVAPDQIKYLIFSHNHPDHAGLIQPLKRLSGARLILTETQAAHLPEIAGQAKPHSDFEPIQVNPADLVYPGPAALHPLGIRGQILPTPGHSADSLSLVMDSGSAFVGDLRPPAPWDDETAALVRQSWERLAQLGARMIYPAHGQPYPFPG